MSLREHDCANCGESCVCPTGADFCEHDCYGVSEDDTDEHAIVDAQDEADDAEDDMLEELGIVDPDDDDHGPRYPREYEGGFDPDFWD